MSPIELSKRAIDDLKSKGLIKFTKRNRERLVNELAEHFTDSYINGGGDAFKVGAEIAKHALMRMFK